MWSTHKTQSTLRAKTCHTKTWYKVTYSFGKPAKRIQAPLSIRNPLQCCRINPDLCTISRSHVRIRWPFGLRLRVPVLGGFQRFEEHTAPFFRMGYPQFNYHDRNGDSTVTNNPKECETKKTPSLRPVARTKFEPGTSGFQKRCHLYLVFGFGVRVWYSTVTSVSIKRSVFQHNSATFSK